MASVEIPGMREAIATSAFRLSIELHEAVEGMRSLVASLDDQRYRDEPAVADVCEHGNEWECCSECGCYCEERAQAPVVHVLTGAPPDGLCLVCDECDGVEGHDGPHDCGHR